MVVVEIVRIANKFFPRTRTGDRGLRPGDVGCRKGDREAKGRIFAALRRTKRGDALELRSVTFSRRKDKAGCGNRFVFGL